MNASNGCPSFERCSAPLCPLDAESVAHGIWYPDEAVCVDFGNQTRYCMQECGAFAFCRDGYVCVLDFPKPDDPEKTYSPFCNQSGNPATTDAVEAAADVTP